MPASHKVRHPTSRTPHLVLTSAPCRPWPCPGLSPGRTTTTTLSPWPSRAVGDPMVRHSRTFQRPVGVPFVLLCGLIGHRSSSGRCDHNPPVSSQSRTSGSRRSTDGRFLTPAEHWDSGSVAFTVERGSCGSLSSNALGELPLSVHALVPVPFRHQVSTSAQECPSKFLPSQTGIRLCVKWRTGVGKVPCRRTVSLRIYEASLHSSRSA